MKTTIITAAIMALTTSAAMAGPNASQMIDKLPAGAVRDAINEVNLEDQRLVDGHYNAETGALTLFTEDMKAGTDGNISRRAVVVDGIIAAQGETGAAGADGKDGTNGHDGQNGADGRDGQDFDASAHRAALASSTALGGLQFQSLSEGQQGWAAGIGGQYEGDVAFAVGANYGVTDSVTAYASIAATVDGDGLSAFIGMSGRF
jgi:hypothetical protein